MRNMAEWNTRWNRIQRQLTVFGKLTAILCVDLKSSNISYVGSNPTVPPGTKR